VASPSGSVRPNAESFAHIRLGGSAIVENDLGPRTILVSRILLVHSRRGTSKTRNQFIQNTERYPGILAFDQDSVREVVLSADEIRVQRDRGSVFGN
jgi:hypothetical protein